MTTWTLHEPDDGRLLEVRPGDVLEVRLGENPTTGYRWEPGAVPAGLVLAASDYALGDARIGGGGQRTVRLEVTAACEGTLELRLRRMWEAEPLRRWTLELRGAAPRAAI